MSDLISREYMKSLGATCIASRSKDGTLFPIVSIDELPPAEQPKERCVATITLSEENLERIVKEQVEEIKDSLTRKGKWIRTRTMTHDGELYCDQCEQEHPEQKIIWNFCPTCGADMRGDKK